MPAAKAIKEHPMKKALLIILALSLASCAGKEIEKKTLEDMKELSLWQILQYKEQGSPELRYEDERFIYNAKFQYLSAESVANKNMIYGMCPIEKTEYKVYDKLTKNYVREETLDQSTCKTCHRR